MKRTFLLPDPGEGLTEAEIVAWRVTAGQEIEVNDVLVEIETAKSLVELPSPWAGTVTALLVAEGTTVQVGSGIVEIDDGTEATLVGYGPADETAPKTRRRRHSAPAGETARLRKAVDTAYEAREPSRRADDVAPTEPVVAAPVGDPLPEVGTAPVESALVLASSPDGVRAKPPVRQFAKDLGVDLGGVVGTGIGGTITRDDVKAAWAFQQQPTTGTVLNDAASFAQPGPDDAGGRRPTGRGERRVPIKGVRKVTAEAMVRSVNTHVHVTEWITVDVTGTMDFVETLKGRREFAGLRVSPLLVYAKAICLALGRNPELNTSWDEQAQEIVFHGDVNLGIAAATPRGLMVPNIKAAQELSLLELCQAINRIVAVSREGKLQPADYSGGTFTITNVGVFGIDGGTPIINGDESAIFCMGAIQRRPWVVTDGGVEAVVPRWVTTLSIAFDHRIIDGEQGSRFLHDVAEILAEPALALLF
ncbi:MAG: dihydrolipoamide acetyltransferase family protein [Propionibacteriaceae bacterium]|nr:dihydrolipoamide acetyltransferase family protein [Propionibacteriaceae bacterium]